MKNLTLAFVNVEREHFGKDVFLVPYYLGKINSCEVSIVFPETETNRELPDEYMGVRLIRVKGKKSRKSQVVREFHVYRYLWKHAGEIDCLMRFHNRRPTFIAVMIYKMRNPEGYVYVKGDMNINKIPAYGRKKDGTNNFLSRLIARRYVARVDCASCELQSVYDKLMSKQEGFYAFGDKLRLIPNGFDESLLQTFGIREKRFSEKDNLMITVARLGTYPKNTEMLLAALALVDFKDWKMKLVGPWADEFQPCIDDFYKQNPDKADSVIFTGAINDKEELWNVYNDAKVFVFTSRSEGSAIVQPEAYRFRNYMVSTDVGAYRQLFGDHGLGESVPQEDPVPLAAALQDIVDGKRNIDVYEGRDVTVNSWENILTRTNPLVK